MKSIGLIEVSGVTAAIDCLDIMCKSADVEFVTWERKLGGRLVTVVVEGQEVFCTDYVLQDVEYYAYFKPLINSDGSIVGCIFAGKTSAEVNAQIAAETNKITLFSAIISVVCVILIFVISMGMSKTMVRTKNFLQVVSTGDLRQSASPRFLKRDDELGDMYAISYTLQEELKGIVTNIKLSADDLSVSSEQLMTLSQDTVSSVSGLYDSVEFISKGAAGGAVLCAELLKAQGYITKK